MIKRSGVKDHFLVARRQLPRGRRVVGIKTVADHMQSPLSPRIPITPYRCRTFYICHHRTGRAEYKRFQEVIPETRVPRQESHPHPDAADGVPKIGYPGNPLSQLIDETGQKHAKGRVSGEQDEPMLRVIPQDLAAARCNLNRPQDANMTREHKFTNQQFYPRLKGKPLLRRSLPDGTQVIRYIDNVGRTFVFRFRRGDNVAHVSHSLEALIKAKWPKSADLLRRGKMICNENDLRLCFFHSTKLGSRPTLKRRLSN